MDYGTVINPADNAEESENRLSDLLKVSSPSIIVVKKERWERFFSHSELRPITAALSTEAKRHGIEIRALPQSAFGATLRDLGCATKSDVSALLARIFPELVWQLPPTRRAWDSEHPRQSVLDAIALGFAAWQHSTDRLQIEST